MSACPITSTSSLKHFVQSGEKGSHFRTEIGHLHFSLLANLLIRILAHRDMYKKWALAEREKASPTETLENSPSQKIKLASLKWKHPKPGITLGTCHALTTLAAILREKIKQSKAQVQSAVENR